MIFDVIQDLFVRLGITWNISGVDTVPTSEDIETVVDHAARVLYAEPVNTRFETKGIIVEKMPTGHDVYVRVGNYQ